MADRDALTRRSVLRIGGTLGIGGLGLAGGWIGDRTSVLAAEAGKLLPANIITTAGSTSLVLDAVMKQEGFFGQMGVDATTQNLSDGSKVIASLLGGSADMCGGSGFSSLFPAIEKGAKIKIIAGAGLRPFDVIMSKNPDIKSAKDLEGKTVGTGALGALLHELVVALLIKKGVDYTKVTFVNVGAAPDIFKAIVAGTIDAGPCEVDTYVQREKVGVHALSDGLLWDELSEYTNQAMFASDQAIAEKRETLVRCMAAYARMYRFVQSPAGQDAWRKARVTVFGKDDPDQARAQWEFFQKPDSFATNLVLNEERTDYVQNLNVKLGVQKAVLPFTQVADMSLAQDALKLLT